MNEGAQRRKRRTFLYGLETLSVSFLLFKVTEEFEWIHNRMTRGALDKLGKSASPAPPFTNRIETRLYAT